MRVELEIQALALQREGLLVEVGRLAQACGFELLRQRVVIDPHGVLLSMVVRGSWFRKRVLRGALDACERLVSYELLPATDGMQAHFAVTRKVTSGYVPPPAPMPEAPVTESAAPAEPAGEAEPAAAVDVSPADAIAIESTDVVPPPPAEDVIVCRRQPPAPEPEPAPEPYVELPQLDADVAAVEHALAHLEREYPRILPRLRALDAAVEPGARAASLQLAGQRVGAWLFAREYALDTGLALDAALAALAVPALHAYAEVELQGGQLHIRHSPLCAADGHSGCAYYGGLLEGLLGPALARRGLSVFPLCCSSFGAHECVLAVSD